MLTEARASVETFVDDKLKNPCPVDWTKSGNTEVKMLKNIIKLMTSSAVP